MKKTSILFAVIFTVLMSLTAVQAQETEPIAVSYIVGTDLPAKALKVLPQSVPAEVQQTLEKIVAAGEGKIRQGDTEVVVWAGADYKKANSPQIVSQLQSAWRTGGWMFEVGGETDGATLFTLLKDGSERRAVVGFYGATEDAFVLAITELHQNGASPKSQAVGQQPEVKTPIKSNASMHDLVGKWEKKSTFGGRVDGNTGAYLGSSGNYESYEFFADGRVAYSTLISVQQGRCNLSAFSQSRGRLNISGAEMTANLSAGTVDRKDTCTPDKDYTRQTSATNTTYGWTVGKDEYGVVQLCLTEPDGKQFCYRRAK